MAGRQTTSLAPSAAVTTCRPDRLPIRSSGLGQESPCRRRWPAGPAGRRPASRRPAPRRCQSARAAGSVPRNRARPAAGTGTSVYSRPLSVATRTSAVLSLRTMNRPSSSSRYRRSPSFSTWLAYHAHPTPARTDERHRFHSFDRVHARLARAVDARIDPGAPRAALRVPAPKRARTSRISVSIRSDCNALRMPPIRSVRLLLLGQPGVFDAKLLLFQSPQRPQAQVEDCLCLRLG